VTERGDIERDIDLGEWISGFGVSVAQLGGALLIIEDAPHVPGQMNQAGLRAELADPTTGAVFQLLDIPLPTSLVDSPEAPAIVTNAAGNEALLGFFAQPTGNGGRDWVARLDCVRP
jgi:hypothetical protein